MPVDVKDVNRSEAIKLGALGVASTGVARVAHELRRVGVEIPIPGEYSFARAVPRFDIWFHLLKENQILPTTSIVMGEFSFFDLSAYYRPPSDFIVSKNNLYTRFFNSNTMTSEADMNAHINAIKLLKEQHGHLISTDDYFSYTGDFGKYNETINLGQERLMLFDIVMAGELVREIIKLNQQNKSGINQIVGPFDAIQRLCKAIDDVNPNINRTIKYGMASILGIGMGDTTLSIAKINEVILTSEKIASQINDSDLINLIELSNIRNITMAQNSRNALSLLEELPDSSVLKQLFSQNGDKPDVLFFAGFGHLKAKENYERGTQYCESQITQKIRDVISKYYNALEMNMKAGKDENNAELLKQLVNITGYFNFPTSTFMNTQSYVETPTFPTHLSPRALMWKFISHNQAKDKDNPSLQAIVGTLVREDFAVWSMMDKVVPGIRQKAENLDACQEIISVRDQNYSYEYRIVDGIPVILNLTN